MYTGIGNCTKAFKVLTNVLSMGRGDSSHRDMIAKQSILVQTQAQRCFPS